MPGSRTHPSAARRRHRQRLLAQRLRTRAGGRQPQLLHRCRRENGTPSAVRACRRPRTRRRPALRDNACKVRLARNLALDVLTRLAPPDNT
ncbi:hypothetical protein [Streptomyces umbrinus]|uniref:hypothetical protein n=1 Tax=Streptomyces umbrinus TaxID=67370 RepID=UPI003422B7F7